MRWHNRSPPRLPAPANRRRRALEIIGPGAAGTIPKLIERVEKDDSPAVRAAAAEALGNMGPPAAKGVDALDGSAERQRPCRAPQGIAVAWKDRPARGPRVPTIVQMLHEDDVLLRLSAAGDLWTIARHSQPAIEVLLNAASDPAASTRATAIELLGQMQANSPEVLRGLVAGLSDLDASVRTAALAAIGRLGPSARSAANRPVAKC